MSRPEQNINISGIEGSDNPYSRDYSELPSEIREFAVPHPAEGPNTHELAVEGSDLKMPVSLHFKGSNFYITGIELKTNTGAIIWGNVSDDAVKIKHIEVAKKLKRTGLSRALLLDLEDQLKREDIKNFYAAFSNPDTINFFMKNGYKIVSFASVPGELRKTMDMDVNDYDLRVSDEDSLQMLKQTGETVFKKVLMLKITK